MQVEHDGSAFLVLSSMTLPADMKSLNLLERGYRLEYSDCQQANGVGDKLRRMKANEGAHHLMIFFQYLSISFMSLL